MPRLGKALARFAAHALGGRVGRNQLRVRGLAFAAQYLEGGEATSLPVITLADPEGIRHSGAYAEQTVERLLDYLLEIDNYRGTGRLYIP